MPGVKGVPVWVGLKAIVSKDPLWRRRCQLGERFDSAAAQDGISLTRRVLEALPPQDLEDEAIRATAEGMIRAAALLRKDNVSTARQ
jgi:hypothetical protein